MIDIRIANTSDSELLSVLSRTTYIESHGHFIEDENDLNQHLDTSFSVSTLKEELSDSGNLFYIVWNDDLPVGYAKLILNAKIEGVNSDKICRLERIYILKEFIPLKLGQQLLGFVENEVYALDCDTIWLTVYVKNYRAIRFYEKNAFEDVGRYTYLVNGTEYPNTVYAKKIKNERVS